MVWHGLHGYLLKTPQFNSLHASFKLNNNRRAKTFESESEQILYPLHKYNTIQVILERQVVE